MVQISLRPHELVVTLAPLERLFSFSGSFTLPLQHIDSAESVPDGLAAVKGIRAPGLGVPGWAKIGTWRRRSGRTFALVRGRGPALRVRASSGGLRDVLISTPDADSLAAQIAELAARSAS